MTPRRRKHKKVLPHQLAPGIAAGYTDSPLSPADARREFPVQRPAKMGVSHLRDPGNAPVFVAESNGGVAVERGSGRKMEDADVTRPAQHVEEMSAGYRCLMCGEGLFERPWPKTCDVCGYRISDFQARDLQEQLVGFKHIGPRAALK